jgi:sRNA-binding regulator protein Hfq|tara:strand:+ start:43 stop:330 length:288 start_codon:yes stop_codon:yes gene_type:complete
MEKNMKKSNLLVTIFLSTVMVLSGCATSQPDYVIYEKRYKHRIAKVIPEARGKTVHVHVHHHGKLTKKEKRWLKKMYTKKHKRKNHKVKVVFVYG